MNNLSFSTDEKIKAFDRISECFLQLNFGSVGKSGIIKEKHGRFIIVSLLPRVTNLLYLSQMCLLTQNIFKKHTLRIQTVDKGKSTVNFLCGDRKNQKEKRRERRNRI